MKNEPEMALAFQCQSTECADRILRAVTKSRLDAPLSLIHIENVQDCTQEELIRQGEYLIAGAYLLYRVEGAKWRRLSEAEKKNAAMESQGSIVIAKDSNKDSFLWDKSELPKRIEFASHGPDSYLKFDELLSSPREGILSDIDISEPKECTIRNARRRSARAGLHI
jgi:hypothetical protein